MSVLSTESLFAMTMAAECVARGDFIASLKEKLGPLHYAILLDDIQNHQEEFIAACREAEERFIKNKRSIAILNLVRASNSDDPEIALRASLTILRQDLAKKRQKLEARKLKLRERIIAIRETKAMSKSLAEANKELKQLSRPEPKKNKKPTVQPEQTYEEKVEERRQKIQAMMDRVDEARSLARKQWEPLNTVEQSAAEAFDRNKNGYQSPRNDVTTLQPDISSKDKKLLKPAVSTPR